MDHELNKAWLCDMIKQCSWLNDSSDTTEYVQDLLINDAIPKGFNYSGRLLRLKAKLKRKSGDEKQISVVLKLKPLNEDQCEFISDHGLFTTETLTYDAVLTKMEELALKNSVEKEFLWPKHFTINHENYLLLEDLKESCHSTITEREATFEEGVKVFQALGRFHAMSRILIDQGSIDINNYLINNMAESETIAQFVYFSSLRAIIDAVRSSEQFKWYDAVDFIEANLNKISPALRGLVKKNTSSYDVLNHGDCWLNNIMFKYSDTNQPTGIKLIDFQLCYYNSFAWDLVHFLYCSYLAENRNNFKHKLISEYRKSLLQSLQLFGSEDLTVPSIEDMMLHVEKLNLFGILNALATAPRLITGIHSNLDLDITLPDEAHKSKTALFAMPRVLENITSDLQQLYELMKEM